MANAFFEVPHNINEPVKSYAPGSPERESLTSCLEKMKVESKSFNDYKWKK